MIHSRLPYAHNQYEWQYNISQHRLAGIRSAGQGGIYLTPGVWGALLHGSFLLSLAGLGVCFGRGLLSGAVRARWSLFPALRFYFPFLIPCAELEKRWWEFSGAGGEWWPVSSMGDKEQKLEEVGNDCGDSSGVRHMRDGFIFLLKVIASSCFLIFSTLWPHLSSLPLARYSRPQFFPTKMV